MRAYVITHNWDGVADNIGLTSSKKLAIKACEDLLSKEGFKDEMHWAVKEKHSGSLEINKATSDGGDSATYRMFMVNS